MKQRGWHEGCLLLGIMDRRLQSFLLCAVAGSVLAADPAAAQTAVSRQEATVMREVFDESTRDLRNGAGVEETNRRIDEAMRRFGRFEFGGSVDATTRIAVQGGSVPALRDPASSVLLFGAARPEDVSDRDFLTGYAPGTLSFTTAQFGAAVGSSFDPGASIQSAFVPRDLAAQIDDLSTLGFAPSMAGERSARVLYATREQEGLLAGVSYSPESSDNRYRKLYQAGLTHETAWGGNLLRVGGTINYGRGRREMDRGDLYAVNVGSTFTVRQQLTFGLSATMDRRSIRGHFEAAPDPDNNRHSRAWGAVASVSYDNGPWTVGAYYQQARTIEKAFDAQMDGLTAIEAGVSYRMSPRTRLYGAYYHYELESESEFISQTSGGVWLAGISLSL